MPTTNPSVPDRLPHCPTDLPHPLPSPATEAPPYSPPWSPPTHGLPCLPRFSVSPGASTLTTKSEPFPSPPPPPPPPPRGIVSLRPPSAAATRRQQTSEPAIEVRAPSRSSTRATWWTVVTAQGSTANAVCARGTDRAPPNAGRTAGAGGCAQSAPLGTSQEGQQAVGTRRKPPYAPCTPRFQPMKTR